MASTSPSASAASSNTPSSPSSAPGPSPSSHSSPSHPTVPGIASVDTCLSKLVEGLRSTTTDPYLKRLTEIADRIISDVRLNAATGAPGHDQDIFAFSGVPDPIYVDGEAQPNPNPINNPNREYLHDIKVQFSKKKTSVAPGYELLEKSINGVQPADLNRGSGGKLVYLSYLKVSHLNDANNATNGTSSTSTSTSTSTASTSSAVSTPTVSPSPSLSKLPAATTSRPITSLSVVFSDMHEEAPYGFQILDRTADSSPANLSTGANGRQVYLCTFRGDGAPIESIGCIFREKKEQLPPGWHEVKHTPFGNKADLNSGSDGTSIYMCFKPDVLPIVQRYKSHIQTSDENWAKCFALLSAVLYCYDQKVVAYSLECFKKLHVESIPPVLLNKFIQCICDTSPLFLTYFSTQTHTLLLKFLLHVFTNFLPSLTLDTMMKMIECCFLARHEDKQNDISLNMLKHLISVIERCKPCACHIREGKDDEKKSKQKHIATSRLECTRCRWRSRVAVASIPDFCTQLILKITDNVFMAEQLEPHVKTFMRHTNTGAQFREDVANLTELLFQSDPDYSSSNRTITSSSSSSDDPSQSTPSSSLSSSSSSSSNSSHVKSSSIIDLPGKEERALFAITLMCCKFGTENAPFNLKKSEMVKRKVHGLRLLLDILQKSGSFFRSTQAARFLLRRFVCPALINGCITDVPSVFRLILQAFTVLWENFRADLMIEIGVFIDHLFYGLLESPYCTMEQKKDIIDVFTHILKTPQSVINLYYNYDNHSKNWNIFERLITILSKLVEGDVKNAGDSKQNVVVGPPSPSNNPANHETEDASTDPLQRHALRLLVHVMHMLAQWIGVPGLKRTHNVPTEPLLKDNATEDTDDPLDVMDDNALPEKSSIGTNTAPASPRAPRQASPDGKPIVENTDEEDAHSAAKGRISRNNTWSMRFDKQKADQKILQHALKLARTEKLKSALQYLKMVNPASALPHEIAKFLFENNSYLDKAEVGDFISTLDDKFLSAEEYEALRWAYLSLIDFTGMTFDEALRFYLCDNGFRLPGESQRIDRLLEVFCKAYCRDNANVFRNYSSAFVVAFAVVMLNTELHDPRLKAGGSRRPMSLEQFINNLRGVDDGHDFARSFLDQLYTNIAINAIEWKEDKPPPPVDETPSSPEDIEKATRKAYEVLVRRGLAYLKTQSACQQGYNTTRQAHIVQAMFELSWFRCIAAITTRSENTRDVDILHMCLDGLAYGSTISIVLDLPTERQAFTRVLAKITFIERNRDSNKASSIPKRIVTGEHLKQDWYRPLNLQSEKYPARACKVILKVCYEIKQRISYERRQAILRSIQTDFGGEIILIDPVRNFVKEGKLIKLNRDNKRAQYHFFLFNDLIVYASEGVQYKYKAHRVIHLSLCRLEDLRAITLTNAFRIVSPQKSFVVLAPTKEKKQQWLDAIVHNLKQVMAKRKAYVLAREPKDSHVYVGGSADGTPEPSVNSSTTQSTLGSSAPGSSSLPSGDLELETKDSEDMLRRYSTFIGQSQSNFDLTGNKDNAAGKKQPPQHCKLCIKSFAIFRRRQQCRWCEDSICSDCCKQKCRLPGPDKTLRQVCDACYGVLKGMVGADVPMLSVVDA